VGDDNTILENEIRGLRLFVGEYQHSLDAKKRLTIPSEWRAQVGTPKSLFVMPDFHVRCLNVYPAGEMTHKLEKLRRHSMADKKAMEFSAVLGAASDVVSWDSQGRIRMNDKLLSFAGLTDQVILIGALDKFQLWSPSNRPEGDDIDQKQLKEAGRYVDF
jgi:MraZ protein